jgi:hypothetical protein
MTKRRKATPDNPAPVAPVLMWAPASYKGWIYSYGIARTRADAIAKWEENDPGAWKRDRLRGWRMIRVVVTEYVDPAQLRVEADA